MRTLLLFPGALGDFLLLVPAATALVRRGARIELSVCRALEPIAGRRFALGPSADGAVLSSLFTDAPAEPLATWLRNADAVHAWLGDGVHVLSRLAARLGIRAVHHHTVVRGDGPTHAGQVYARALAVEEPLVMPSFGFESATTLHPWRAPFADRLLIHPGAGSRNKRWAGSGFRRVADGWVARGGEIAVLLGPAEEELRDSWRASGHACVCSDSIAEAGTLIASAARYLGNDSGISHLAGAAGRAGAVLFGPTRAARWRPLGGRLAALRFPGEDEKRLAARILAALDAAGCRPRGARDRARPRPLGGGVDARAARQLS